MARIELLGYADQKLSIRGSVIAANQMNRAARLRRAAAPPASHSEKQDNQRPAVHRRAAQSAEATHMFFIEVAVTCQSQAAPAPQQQSSEQPEPQLEPVSSGQRCDAQHSLGESPAPQSAKQFDRFSPITHFPSPQVGGVTLVQ